MNTRTGLALRTLPVHLMCKQRCVEGPSSRTNVTTRCQLRKFTVTPEGDAGQLKGQHKEKTWFIEGTWLEQLEDKMLKLI